MTDPITINTDDLSTSTVSVDRLEDPAVDTDDGVVQTKDSVATEIESWIDNARSLAREVGLDPYEVKYWIVTNEEMDELITYNGFQERYPHWRWGMRYNKQRKETEYLPGKAFEIVNNDDPCHAFLQRSNTVADQKSVVTHVEAHADFFKNNQWFQDSPNAVAMLGRHADRIKEIMSRPDVDRDDVEWLIDTARCLEDTIDQQVGRSVSRESDDEVADLESHIDSLEIEDSLKSRIFDDEWIEEHSDGVGGPDFHQDVLGFFLEHGQRYDDEEQRAVEFEDWEREVLSIIRDEAYYFAPQKMTKVMNEGWASKLQTIMMADEGFADMEDLIEYANHHSKVLAAPGMNPYRIGHEIWDSIENRTNRREVVERLLAVDGITPGNFHRTVDFDHLEELLSHPDSYSAVKRNYSLVRRENRGFVQSITRDELIEINRFVFESDRYETIEDAISDVDYGAGWDRMMDIRATHVDSTFIGEFIDEEFIRENDYFTYDYNPTTDRTEVSSTDPLDVKKKLLLQTTNAGKPTIVVEDDNYLNAGQLLLTHKYNGISLDIESAKDLLERIFEIWGRPVNLRTIIKSSQAEESMDRRNLVVGQLERDVQTRERGMEIQYDGAEFQETRLDDHNVEYIMADEIDYETRPEEWL